ncbi:MAG TPA: hypothetical protein VM900_05185, partial [Sphingomonas sp.]|nr:hypothetical protein [Sphingomonas sp.]
MDRNRINHRQAIATVARSANRGTDMKLKHAFCCGAALCLAPATADAAKINLIDLGGVSGSQAEVGFKIAAAYWGSVLSNNVTINLGVGFNALDEGVIGQTGSTRIDYSVRNWERQVGLTRSNSTLDMAAVLPTLNAQGGATFITNGSDADGNDDTGSQTVVLGNSRSSQILYANSSVLKAIGALGANSSVVDGNVTFSSEFA